MIHEEGNFRTDNGEKLFYQFWLPTGQPKAVLLVVHGLAEHSGRYMNIVNHFVPLGYAVYGVDHLGHGKSDGTRVYVDHFEDYIEPLDRFTRMVHDWQPGLPMFLIGHSLGGLITSIYLLDHQAGIQGAILSGAAVKIPDNINGTTITMGRLLSALAPKVGLVGLDANMICHDPAVVQAYINDPLVTTSKTSARLAAEMLKAMQRVDAEASKISLPVLIMHGGEDRLINPKASQMLYERVSSKDKTLHIWEGLYHEIYNEPEREKVFGEIEAWLKLRV